MNCLHDRFNPSIENMFATLKIEFHEDVIGFFFIFRQIQYL